MGRPPPDSISVGGKAGGGANHTGLSQREGRDGERPSPARATAGRGLDVLKLVAGPFLIVASVLVILKDFATGSLFPRQFELLGEWQTTFCFLGRSLRAGHIPSLDPHVMGGIPYAPDPQSGWMNVPLMGLFTGLRCDLALRWYLILLPILAGLGIYWFLRSEGLGRPAATVGGLVLALPLAGSKNFSLPWVSGTLAWTAVLLATASRFWHARGWSTRILWALACALAWGQLASAHFSTGLVVGTAFFGVYLLTKAVTDVLAKRSTPAPAFLRVSFVLAASALVGLAFLIPRLVYLRRTPLGLGFDHLQTLYLQFGGRPGSVLSGTSPPPWPLAMAMSPGIHQGAIALGLCFGGLMIQERRWLTAVFGSLGFVCYALTLPVAERILHPRVASSFLSGAYLHAPNRLVPGVLVAVSVLAGLGVESWVRAPSMRHRMLSIGPGVLTWALLLLLFRPAASRLELVALGAVLGAIALLAAWRAPELALLIPLVVALELSLNGRPLSGQRLAAISREPRGAVSVQDVVAWTKIDGSAFLRAGPIAAALRSEGGGRYVTSSPADWYPLGYFGHLTPATWGLMGDQQSLLFGLREAQGYNAVLPLRVWEFVRAVEEGKNLRYQSDYFLRPPEVALDLLQVGWVVGRAGGSPPLPGAAPVALQGRWALYRLARTPPMATVLGGWTQVGSPDAALDLVAGPGFDPEHTVVLEQDPGLPSPPGGAGGPGGRATYRQLGPQAATIQVEAPGPAIVVVRNTYDPNWHASVDGRPVQVLPADYLVQGIPVPAGSHVVHLWYDDPTIGYGLAGSAASIGVLLGAALVLRLRRRPRDRPGTPPRLPPPSFAGVDR